MTFNERLESFSAADLVAWTLREFGGDAAIASSFGLEDVALIDLASRSGQPFSVFTLDTDFLFPETYALIDQLERRYGFTVDRARSEFTPQQQAERFGDELWRRDPDACCNLRKVQPLKAKLAMLGAWITGIRRDQAPTRAKTRKVEWDAKFRLMKFNPLADWTWDDVRSYVRENDVPYNPLHDRGYPSIGCTYCTRAVAPGEDPRAGRWAGTAKTECGLHSADGENALDR